MTEAEIHRLPLDRIALRRVGLVADTHSSAADGSDLPGALFTALRGVDLILHLGDMGDVRSLARFAAVAPVLAVRGGHGVGEDTRIASPARLIETPRCTIGVVFDVAELEIGVIAGEKLEFPPDSIGPALARAFGRRIDVLAFAATHRPLLAERDGVLFVNPGSPNLPVERGPTGLGTVALVDLSGAKAVAEIRAI